MYNFKIVVHSDMHSLVIFMLLYLKLLISKHTQITVVYNVYFIISSISFCFVMKNCTPATHLVRAIVHTSPVNSSLLQQMGAYAVKIFSTLFDRHFRFLGSIVCSQTISPGVGKQGNIDRNIFPLYCFLVCPCEFKKY